MSDATRSYCPTCAQEIGGWMLLDDTVASLKSQLVGVQELYRRELELRTGCEKVREGQLKVIIDLQQRLDQAEDDLQVLGLKLLRVEEK